jgi:hypothetical protein
MNLMPQTHLFSFEENCLFLVRPPLMRNYSCASLIGIRYIKGVHPCGRLIWEDVLGLCQPAK